MAEQLLTSIIDEHDVIFSQQKNLLMTQLYLKKSQPKEALKSLLKVSDLSQLPLDMQADYYRDAAATYLRNNDLLNSIIARIKLIDLQPNKAESIAEQEGILRDLQTISFLNLQNTLKNNDDLKIAGWIELAIIAKQYANQSVALASNIKQWKLQYPTTIAQQILPLHTVLADL